MAPELLACTVIVCTYNRADRLPRTLEALAAQDFDPESFELIVVDNASKDATRQVVEAHLPRFRHARYVYEGTQGLSAARNRGIAEARGRILAFTDDDCIPAADWLRAMLEPFSAASDIGAVVGRIVPDWEDEPPAWLDMGDAGAMLACLDYGDAVVDLPVDYVRGASIAFAAPAVARVGAFRTDLGLKGTALLGNDETEFCLRLQHLSYRLVYTPHAMVRHHIPADRMVQQYFVQRWYGQGRANYRMQAETQVRSASQSAIRLALAAGLAVAQFYIARRRVRRLQRVALPALTPALFNGICWLSCEAGVAHERMAMAFGAIARQLSGAGHGELRSQRDGTPCGS